MSARPSHLAASLLCAGFLVAACNRADNAGNADKTGNTPVTAADLARLAAVPTNDISKNPELLNIALKAGRAVYDNQCAACHGADLKGAIGQHLPDLTDNEWVFAGDDLDTGGLVHFPADVETTVRYGIRAVPPVTNLPKQSDNDAANLKYKNLAVMPAFGPGLQYDLSEAEIADVAEYTLKISGQDHNAEMAARGQAIFAGKGNCYDCHGPDAEGNAAIGGPKLQIPRLFMYGASREAILTSLKQGRTGVMPGFEAQLKPEEIKAVAVYVFRQGGPGEMPPPFPAPQ